MPKKCKRVAYLSPEGSFTHEAAMSRLSRYEMVPKNTLETVFDSVFVHEVDYGVLPVENSTHGIIALTYHKLVEQGRNPRVTIQGEIYHTIAHNLCAVASIPLDSVAYVHTKEEAWDQCRKWVSTNLPKGVEFVAENSTSRAAEIVAQKGENNRVAIASTMAMEKYNLHAIAKSIQDYRDNTTRFFILGHRPLPLKKSRNNISYKLTMGIVLLDRIGAIADAFKVFADTHVDVRSVKVSPVRAPEILSWKDWFFVDVLAPNPDFENVNHAIKKLRDKVDLILTVRELGQYPSGYPEEIPKRKAEFPSMPRDVETPGGLSLDDIIAAGEGITTEFKSTLRWNVKEAKADKDIEFAVLKTIVGFVNSRGGILLIGVEDDGNIHGIEDDINTLHKHTRDWFESHLRNLLQRIVGGALLHLIDVRFASKEGKDVCIVTIQPSPSPIFVPREGKNEFYVRSGNQTRSFDNKETTEYVKFRWG